MQMLKSLPVAVYLLLLTFSASVGAAPRIDNVSIEEGELQILGVFFGVKSPAAPILWETFEDGTDGAYLPTSANWVAYNRSTGGEYDNAEAYSGVLSAHNAISSSSDEFRTSYTTFPATDKVYYTYYSKYSGSGGDVIKHGRVGSTSDYYSGAGVAMLSDGYVSWYTDGGSFYAPSVGDEDSGKSRYLSLDSSAWTRHSIFRDAGNSIEFSSGTTVRSYSNVSNITKQSGSVLLGLMVANATSTHNIWVDDVYIDNTKARVELCEGATWSTRIACDIQIPTSWSDSTIKATVNTGTFQTDDIAYLYVVDSDGTVNSSGYQVIIGETQVASSLSSGISSSTYDYGSFSWQQPSYAVERSSGYVYLTLARLDGSDGDVSVQWSSNGETAFHDIDYYGADNVTVSFADGETSKQIAIQLIQNAATDDRTFSVSLSNAAGGAALGSISSTSVTILGTSTISPPPTLRIQ